MYRVYVDGAWLQWVSNANPIWMRKVKNEYGLTGELNTSAYCAGIYGKDIGGINIRVYQEDPLGELTGRESTSTTLQYMVSSERYSFKNSVVTSQIDGTNSPDIP